MGVLENDGVSYLDLLHADKLRPKPLLVGLIFPPDGVTRFTIEVISERRDWWHLQTIPY